MAAIWWVLLGMVVGLSTRRLMPREDTDSVLLDILAGAVGGATGGYLFRTYSLGHVVQYAAWWSSLLALVGASAIVLLVTGLTMREQEEV
ncbi:MAG: hypothetical protein ACP5VE_03270 [Chthonomonadales bacterium]